MPCFVIHEMGQPPKTIKLDEPQVTIGRQQGSHVQLSDVSVSREHAVVWQASDGNHYLKPVAKDRLVAVDGQFIDRPVRLKEGTELQVGNVLLVFSQQLNPAGVARYQRPPMYSEGICNNCGWKGRIGGINRQPICPCCGHTDLTTAEELRKREAAKASTHVVSEAQMNVVRSKLHMAHNSHIKRMSPGPGSSQIKLDQERTFSIGRKKGADIELTGFQMGANDEVRWEHGRYVIEHNMRRPSMTVNGESVKKARLSPGDVILIGKNQLQYFVVGSDK